MAKLKLKTKRAAAKRFKVTGTGKLVRNKAYKSHILTKIKQRISVYREHLNLVCLLVYAGDDYGIASHIGIVRHVSGVDAQYRYDSVISQLRIDLSIDAYQIRIELYATYVVESSLDYRESCRNDSSYTENQHKHDHKRYLEAFTALLF